MMGQRSLPGTGGGWHRGCVNDLPAAALCASEDSCNPALVFGPKATDAPDCDAAGRESSRYDHAPAATSVCAPCVARPSPLPQRVAAVQAAILVEREPLVTVTHLLQLCRDEHPVLWERISDPATQEQLAPTLSDLVSVLPAPSTALTLNSEVRQALSRGLTSSPDLPAVVIARALAELLDERYADTFTTSFRARSPYQPGVGDPIPLDCPDLRRVTALQPTSPPWRLANRLDETRHVRLAGEWAAQFQVIFDYTHAEALDGLMGPDTVLATCHPNRTLAELDLPVDAAGLTFGVRPLDEQKQRREIDRVIRAAVSSGASIVLLPELCVTESLAADLRDWTCRPDGPRLLVAGSYHHEDIRGDDADPATDSGRPRRRNTAVAYVRGGRSALTQDKHSPADRPVMEDIQPSGWPRLHVHVSADGWHLAMAICRDLLNPHAVHALTEAGVNLALVPAMSQTLIAFGGPVAQMVGAGQAFVAVANNPAEFCASSKAIGPRPARAIFGHPGFGQQTRFVQPRGSEPGVSLLRVRTGQLEWLDTGEAASSRGPSTARSTLPEWAVELTQLCASKKFGRDREPVRGALRPAAVLVVIVDTPGELGVLLTRRAPDMARYAGQLVFPGGAVEPCDDGPVGTALREATEETGLDIDSVQILGTLPAMALPDDDFLLTPVLAWSSRPVFSGSRNIAEVSALATLPLALPGGEPREAAAAVSVEGVADDAFTSQLGAVTAILIDLLNGLLARPRVRRKLRSALDAEPVSAPVPP